MRCERSVAVDVGRVCIQLRTIANDINDARPLLGPLLRNLTGAIERATYVNDGPFILKLPPNAREHSGAKTIVVQLAEDLSGHNQAMSSGSVSNGSGSAIRENVTANC